MYKMVRTMKKQQNQRKMASYKALSSTILVLCILLVTSISLNSQILTVDNVKSFNNKTGKYGVVTIKDNFGLGATLSTLELKTNTFYCKNDCSAEIQVVMNEKGVLVDDVIFKRLNLDDMKTWNNIEVKNYKLYVDGSPYSLGTEVNAGTYILRLEGKKPTGSVVDWILNTQGTLITEWATWSDVEKFESYETGYDNNYYCSATSYCCQTFTLGTTGTNKPYEVFGASYWVQCPGCAGGGAWIRTTNSSGSPTLVDLVKNDSIPQAVNGWSNITWNQTYTLTKGETYAFCWNGTSASTYTLNADSSGSYTGGAVYEFNGSSDAHLVGGGTYDLYFQIYGLSSPPTITQNQPTNMSDRLKTVNFNCTATSDSGLLNLTLILDDATNYTISNTTASDSELSFSISNTLSKGSHNYTCNSVDEYNTQGNGTIYFFNVTDVAVYSQTFNSITSEGAYETFTANVSYSTINYTNVEGIFYYNNTPYIGTKTSYGGGNILLSRSLDVPIVTADRNVSFYWTVRLNNGTWSNHNLTGYNQTIKNIAIGNCTDYGVVIMNLSHLDENTKDFINSSKYNSTMELDLNLYSPNSDNPIINYSTNYSSNNASVCVGVLNTIYYLDAQIRYDADGYASEYYNIQNTTLTNNTAPIKVNLYDLLDSESTEFIITYKDSNFLPLKDGLIQVQRKYVADGVFRTVEQPKTDALGETVAHLKTGDTIYTFVITKGGEILATFENKIPVCQNPTLETCEINLNSFASSISPQDYTIGDDFSYTMSFNYTSRTVSTIFSIPSGSPANVSMNVTLFDNIGTTKVCSNSLESSSGTLSCVVPNSFGNSTVIVNLYKDGLKVGGAIISLDEKPVDIYGTNFVFIAIFLMLSVIGLGLNDNPMVLGFFFILGAGLLIALNLTDTGLSKFYSAGATFMWLIIAVVIVMIKGAKRT